MKKYRELQFVARLALDARQAVLAHHQDRLRYPEEHRGCLWCYDGRLSHWASDTKKFYCSPLTDGRSPVDAALDLYARRWGAP